jgi:hypothetical protein
MSAGLTQLIQSLTLMMLIKNWCVTTAKVQNEDEEAQENAQQYVVSDTERNMIWVEV